MFHNRFEFYSKILREVNEEKINFSNLRDIIIYNKFYKEELFNVIILYKDEKYSRILF